MAPLPKLKVIIARAVLAAAPFVIAAVLIVPSCKDQTSQTSNLVLPDSNLSFSHDIEPLFAQTCLGSQCHSGTSPARGLDLTPPSYQSLMYHNPTLVVGGAPNNSLLVQRLDGTFPPIMPSNQSPLTANQIKGVRQWIKEGAKNN
ncbi:MAG TPA: hypothetical protein VMM37_10900 [Bacteroidota bacterium]|nr:hypothetical protein [Bacteroidota bacterium]